MKNIILNISYDGSNYSGWQRQNNANSIQETIENAIYKITDEKVDLIASGRTDSGVHALGQIANFKTYSNIRADKFAYAINSNLPDDIRINYSNQTDIDFNSRFMAKKKTYIYQIYNNDIKNPFNYKYTMQVKNKLNFELMQENIKMLIGTYDWTSFYTKEKDNPKNPIRTVYDCSLSKNQDILTIEITGNGFLYNMVRIIAGTLIEIGLDKKNMNIEQIIKAKDRKYAGATAKACGLFLKNVEYKV